MNKNIGIMTGVVLLISLISLSLVNAHGSENGINIKEKNINEKQDNNMSGFLKNMMGNMMNSNVKNGMMHNGESEGVNDKKGMHKEMHEKMEKLMKSEDFEGMKVMHEKMETIYESENGNFKEKGSCPMMN